MKKKNLNIVLIVVLLLVWGSVIKKHFGSNSKVMAHTTLANPKDFADLKSNRSENAFQLVLTNMDPFKATIRKPSKKNNTTQVKVEPKKRSATPAEALSWPRVSYHGFVKSEDKNTRLVILRVNDKLHKKREQEKIDDIVVIKAYTDSLVLALNKEHRTIERIVETPKN